MLVASTATPAASPLRTPPSRPRASARSPRAAADAAYLSGLISFDNLRSG